MTTISPEMARRVLDVPMWDNDAGAATIREYLIALLAAVWEQEESFSGKRPFGSSGWKSDLDAPLLCAGLVPGTLHSEGYVIDCDDEAADALITAAIAELGRAPRGEA